MVFSAEDRFAIEELNTAWLNAELRGHSTALLEFCTAVPVWLPPNEPPLCGRAAILDWLGDQPEIAVLQIDINDLAISGMGPLAWKVANFRTTLESPADGGARTVTGTHGWLLQRDDTTWRIAVVAWTMA